MRKPVMPYAINKGADQPAHPPSLISAFDVRCLDSIIPPVRNFKPLHSFCGCVDRFEPTVVANLEDRFSRDEAQIRTDHNGHHCRTSSERDQLGIMSLQSNGEGGGILHLVWILSVSALP